jgi:hypothetical protein
MSSRSATERPMGPATGRIAWKPGFGSVTPRKGGCTESEKTDDSAIVRPQRVRPQRAKQPHTTPHTSHYTPQHATASDDGEGENNAPADPATTHAPGPASTHRYRSNPTECVCSRRRPSQRRLRHHLRRAARPRHRRSHLRCERLTTVCTCGPITDSRTRRRAGSAVRSCWQ